MARKPRHLSPDEAELWARVKATSVPLRPDHPTRKVAAPKPAPPDKLAMPQEFAIGLAAAKTGSTRINFAPTPAERLAGEPLEMDRKAYRKLARGKLKPEARLDLHGMTLARAHPALTGFVLSSQAAGRRLVLVITGKGRGGREEDGPIPVRRGALRNQVPGWLRSAPCGGAVLQVVQAHPSHGGDGAYYVYLRRPRK